MKSTSEKALRILPQPAGAAARTEQETGFPQRPDVVTPTTSHHWTFLTNHSHVLVLLARNPSMVLREVALQVGITERAVQRIIQDLEADEILDREKVGRQNHYRIRADKPLRHPIESHRTIGELLALVNEIGPGTLRKNKSPSREQPGSLRGK